MKRARAEKVRPRPGPLPQEEGEPSATHLTTPALATLSDAALYEESLEPVDYGFGLKRRSFVQILGAGLLIAASIPALAQQRRGRGGGGFGGSGAKNVGA